MLGGLPKPPNGNCLADGVCTLAQVTYESIDVINTDVEDQHKSAFIWVAGSGPLIQERKCVYWYQDVLARGLNAASGAGKPLVPKLT